MLILFNNNETVSYASFEGIAREEPTNLVTNARFASLTTLRSSGGGQERRCRCRKTLSEFEVVGSSPGKSLSSVHIKDLLGHTVCYGHRNLRTLLMKLRKAFTHCTPMRTNRATLTRLGRRLMAENQDREPGRTYGGPRLDSPHTRQI